LTNSEPPQAKKIHGSVNYFILFYLRGQVALERESALVAGAQFGHEICKVLQPRGPGDCRTRALHSQRLRMRREDRPRQTNRQL
jgi:hypothetical protein